MTRSPATGREIPSLDLQSVDAGVRGAADTLTFGLADEIAAGGDTLIGKGSYDQNLVAQRARDTSDAANHPVARTVGQVAGAMAGAGAAIKAAPTLAPKLLGMGGKSLAGKMAASAASGAGMAALHGFGSGEGGAEKRAAQAFDEARWGAATGAAAPVVGTVVGKAVGALLDKAPPPPSVDDLREGAKAAYKAADDAGLFIAPKSFAQFGSNLAKQVAEAGIDPDVTPKAAAAMKRIQMAVDQPLRLQDVDTLRKVAGGAASSNDAHERMLGSMIRSSLDDYLTALRPADVISGDTKKATQSLMKARSLWSRMRKSELIEQAFEKSDMRAASTGSGANIDNVTRQNVRGILTNPKTARMFSKEEKQALKTVVNGTATGNTLRFIGKLAPSGIVSTVLSGGAGAAAGGPVGAVVVPAVGFAAKKSSDMITAKHLRYAEELIRRGAPAPKAGSPVAAAYAQLLAQSAGQGAVAAGDRPPLQIEVTRPANWEQARPQ